MIKKRVLLSRWFQDRARRRKSVFHPVGFHGDQFLLSVVDLIVRNTDTFIETGTNVGSTVAYLARQYPNVHCFSCEPDYEAFQQAVRNTKGLSNVVLYNMGSLEFFEKLGRKHGELFRKKTLFWLDAHGYGFDWPLKEEVAFITKSFASAHVLIDDFKVPGLDIFGYDEYQDQECSFDYIKDALDLKHNYTLYYPNYTERTSQHHPLRGWGLIEFGHTPRLSLPEYLQDKVTSQRVIL